MERKYFVANANGDVAGHDMDLPTAEKAILLEDTRSWLML